MLVSNLSNGASVATDARRATSLWARSKGLLGRKSLEPGEGLLIDPCSGIHMFFMAFPIDAIFVDKRGTVVHLVREIGPWRASRYVFKARAVLEVPAGTIRRTGTSIGDRLAFED